MPLSPNSNSVGSLKGNVRLSLDGEVEMVEERKEGYETGNGRTIWEEEEMVEEGKEGYETGNGRKIWEEKEMVRKGKEGRRK